MRAQLAWRWVVVTTLLLVPACDTSDPAFGALRLMVLTTGGDIDLDGYVARLDGVAHRVTVNDTLVLKDLASGEHRLTLHGVASNCTPGGASQTVMVRGERTTDVTVQLACAATGVRVTTVTTGLDIDSVGYTVFVDGLLAAGVLGNGAVEVTRLPAGTHVVSLAAIAPNCTTADNPRSVVVAASVVAPVAFNTTCGAVTGVVEVRAATSGIDLDPDGYLVRIDDDTTRPLAINGTSRFTGVSGGAHSVTLSGATLNCAVEADNPRTIAVTTGGTTTRDTARTTFNVSCASNTGTLRITTATSGVELDPDGYTIVVDEDCSYYYYYNYCYTLWTAPIGITALATNTSIPIGSHAVRLDGVADNCIVAGQNPRTVTVPSAAIADETFTVTCVQTGSIQVTTTTTGVDLDADGYVVSVDGQGRYRTATLAVNGNLTFAGLLPGAYSVTIGGASANCTVASPNPRAVTVSSGATALAAIDASCATAATLAFARGGDIHRVKVNGAEPARLTFNTGHEDMPAWSPDGSQIAFRRDSAGDPEIYLMSADGSGQTRLTWQVGPDYLGSWSSTGLIAFASERNGNSEIYVMKTDGTGVTNLTNNNAGDSYPAWSPDGSKIAFQSTRDNPNGSIYVMAADGSGVPQRITDGGYGGDGHPTWSPDGTKIAFHRVVSCDYYYCERDLYVVNAAGGSAPTQLTSGPEDNADPAWSPDGGWIAFSAAPCDYYNGCYNWRIMVVRSDGTDARDVVSGAYQPAWKP